LVPIDILLRVTKQLQHFATITDGYTNRIYPLVLYRELKKVTAPAINTDAFTNGRPTFQHVRLSDCLVVSTITDRVADRRGKSNARVL
jgi:hypothetical protein